MRIRLAENFRAVFYAPYYATKALGFYADEGVDIDLLSSVAPGSAVSQLRDGTIDVTWGGPMRVMKARDERPDSPLVCFGEMVARDPFYLIGRNQLSDFQLADLAGLRFAAVSEVPTPWMCLQHDLRERNIDPSRIERASERPMADNLAALRAGQLDVIQVFEPYVSVAINEGCGKVLYAGSSRGPTVYTTFIASRDGTARHRAAFAGMVRAIARMQHWLAAHPAEELAELTTWYYPDVSLEILSGSLERYRQAGLWAATPQVSRQGFARLADSLLSGGFITRLSRLEECVDAALDQ